MPISDDAARSLVEERDQLKAHLASLSARLTQLDDEVVPALVAERDDLKGHVERLTASLEEAGERDAALAADLAAARASYEALRRAVGQQPPGHFFSPVPDFEAVLAEADRIWPEPKPISLAGIDLDDAGQTALLASLDLSAGPGRRFEERNPAFGLIDGRLYAGMLRHLRPGRLVEVGSGHSTALLLDVVEATPGWEPQITCIEPYPAVLHERLLPGDTERITLLDERVQDVDPAVFAGLGAGDVLFIDSTHVAKVGSDVNHLVFEVIPRLADGVVVHIHDIDYPFEYRRAWVEQGRAWSEAYLVRALLIDNRRLRVLLFSSYLQAFHDEQLEQLVPGHRRNPGGSLWLDVAAPA